MTPKGTLIFFCGKMAAGKSTLSARLAREMNAIRISEDDWLSALYPEEINDFGDYRKYSSRLKPARAKFDTEEVFRHVTSFFQPPADEEGFDVQVVKQGPE
ncbi:MAG TPA: ATP-binding protein [Alphaproteobacteria bacterium]|nr:ATP-binding protein [Alphaproteobacteria bacterium]